MATYWNSTNTAQYSDVTLSGISYIDALLAGGTQKWGGATGSGTTLTYSIPGNLVGGTSYWETDYSYENEPGNLGYAGATLVAAFAEALQTWSDVADINFVQVEDGATEVGDIRLAFYNDLSPSYAGWAYYPGNRASSGDVWLSPGADWSGESLQPGRGSFEILLHEIGHALGLSHPEDVGTAAGYDIGTTLMSYNEHPQGLYRTVTEDAYSYYWSYEYVQPSTPMLYDIAAIQHLYGANTTYHTGNDTYTFDPATPFFQTIWDAGGVDTISISNFSRGSEIDLRQGSYSSIRIPSDPLPAGQTETYTNLYDGTDNLAIAFGVVIENAIGGAGADVIYGNTAANRLNGMGGRDRLLGFGGNDVLNGGGGADTMLGGGGNDIYFVENSGDRVYETTTVSSNINAGGVDTVKSSIAYTLGSYVENLTLTGAKAINGSGNGLANRLVGNNAANALNGAGGNDTLNGYGGNDRLIGGAGNDRLVGNGGADTLIGGGGKDTLIGGDGNDVFRFNALGDSRVASTARDVITDFGRGADRIDLSGIDADAGAAGNQAFSQMLAGGTAFTQAGQLKFEGGVLYGNTDGDASAEFAIALTGVSNLSLSDIIV